MVSFSCENCGDVLTKKKLDSHRGQCHGASYTCLDCHVHFAGTSYRSHTSCITEAQKYEGALYKSKSKQNLRDQRGTMSQAVVPRKAYVESTEDLVSSAVAIVDAPPRAPSPPPATDVNVFDFLVPNHGQAALAEDRDHDDASKALPSPDDSGLLGREEKEEEKDVWYDVDEPVNDPMQYEQYAERKPREYVHHYQDPMFSYGSAPVAPEFERFDSYTQFPPERPEQDLYTPAPRKSVSARGHGLEREESSTAKKSAKRKRGSPDHINISATKPLQPHLNSNGDIVMADAPATLHSGLTGGLNKLMSSRHGFPPSPDVSGEGEGIDGSPLSPIKKAKHTSREDRGRDPKARPVLKRKAPTARVQLGFSAQHNAAGGSSSKREERPSPPGRDRDAGEHRRRRRRHRSASPGYGDDDNGDDGDARRGTRARKAIEYPGRRDSGGGGSNTAGALIRRDPGTIAVRGGGDGDVALPAHDRAELFISFITKGPDSERGYSVNKALKRYHRERSGADVDDEDDEGGGERGGRSRRRSGRRDDKAEEEKELWKSLRLRRNDRGEVVLFF